MIRPQSIILTLYGDYIRHRGVEIRVNNLINLLSNFGLSEEAIRSALFRMCRKGLLKARRVGKQSYYSLTDAGKALLAKGEQRIFERRDNRWDGTWHIVTYSIPEERREIRDRLRQELSWMGYGPLGSATWISPYNLRDEVEELAETLQIKGCIEIFQAEHLGFASSSELVARCWDVKKLHERYAAFIANYGPKLEAHRDRLRRGESIEPSECFVERFMLIHEYRRFPFFDPELPIELLPKGWLRPKAVAIFQEYHNLLAEKANQYFDSVFTGVIATSNKQQILGGAKVQGFQEVFENRHQYAKDWKARTGGKVVGYFCTYTPEEILYAANILPVRILGGHEPPTLATPHMFDMWCPFSRDCLNQGLKGRYDYLDGVMIAQSCLHAREAFGAWEIHVPTPWRYYLCMPNAVRSPRAKPFLAGELAEFKKAVEEWVGKSITDEDLDRGIDIVNNNRSLMKQVYEYRKEDNPPLTGTEAMTMVWASQLMDKREHSKLTKRFLEELPNRKLERDPGVRLMIVGSENDDRPFMEMVESVGGTFVIDDHCTGSRYFWDEVVPNANRIQAIANRYCDRVPCPSKDWGPTDWQRVRFPHILNLAREFQAQGVVLTQQKFCDPHELDIPSLRRYLESNDLPCYFLEFEVTVPVGQFRIRMEAFIEQIEAEALFA